MVNVKGKKKISFVDENEYIGSKDNNIEGMIKSGATKLYLEIDPLVVAGYYYNSGNYERVIKTFRQMNIEPNYSRVSYLLWAKTLFAMNKYTEALDKIELAYKSNGSEKLQNLVYIIWGEILRKSNKYNEAISKFEAALKINSDDSYSNYMIGDLLILQGKYRDSVIYLKNGLAIDKKRPDANKESQQIITNMINTFSTNTDDNLDPLKTRWNELLITNM